MNYRQSLIGGLLIICCVGTFALKTFANTAADVLHAFRHPLAAIQRLGRQRPTEVPVQGGQAVGRAATDELVAEIRQRYPNPQPLHWGSPSLESGYDVGGALCMFLGEQIPYPTYKTLGRMLARLNPSLDAVGADNWARLIIHAYEFKQYRDPWTILAEALRASEGPS